MVFVYSVSFEEIKEFLAIYGPPIVIIVGLIICTLFGLAWLSRFFKYLQIKGSKHMSKDALELLEIFVAYILIAIIWVALLYTGCKISPLIKEYAWNLIMPYFYVITLVFIVLLIGTLIGKTIHTTFLYLKGELKEKPKKIVSKSVLDFIELPLKYFVYILSGVVAFLIVLSSLAVEWKKLILTHLYTLLWDNIEIIVVIIVLILVSYLVYRFIDLFLEDVKKRTTRTNPHLLDIVKTLTKVLIVVLVSLTILSIVLTSIGLAYVSLLIFGITVVMILLFGIIVVFTPIKHAISGIVLMRIEPFHRGDRVKVANIVGDVLALHLLYTKIRTQSGEIIEIPNTEILENSITNFSKSKNYVLSLQVMVNCNVDRKKVEDCLLTSAKNTPGVVSGKVYAISLRDNKIKYEVRVLIDNLNRTEEIRSDMIFNIQQILKDENISIE